MTEHGFLYYIANTEGKPLLRKLTDSVAGLPVYFDPELARKRCIESGLEAQVAVLDLEAFLPVRKWHKASGLRVVFEPVVE